MSKCNEERTPGGPLAVSIPEAARLIGVGRSTIYKAMTKDGLPSVKLGKRRLIQVDALRRWITSRPAA